MKHRSLPLVVFLLGLTVSLLQVVALREFVVLFSGNELDLGITLAVWLAATGAGSMAGRRLSSPRALGAAVLGTALLSLPLLSLVPFLRPLLGLDPGEALSLVRTVAATAAVLAPLCFLAGMQFPLCAAALGSGSTAYFLEAAGACAGGLLFTFLLAGRVPALWVLVGTSTAGILIAAALLRRKTALLALLLPLAVMLIAPRFTGMSREGGRPELRTESRYGLIEIERSRDQHNVFSSGRFLYAYPDRPTEELRAHLPLLLHPRPERVLIVGGSPALVREVLKDRVRSVEYVELDPALIAAARTILLPPDLAALNDPRVIVHAADARRFIKSAAPASYDLVMLNLPEPSTADANRCYTREFFREVRSALRRDGVVTLNLPLSFGYVGRRMQTANGSIFRALGEVFPYTALSSEEYGLLAGSAAPIETDLPGLRSRLRQRTALLPLHPFVIDDVFEPLAVSVHRSRLGAVAAVNRDNRPVAYLYNLLVWAEMQRSGLLLFLADHGPAVILCLIALASLGGVVSRRRSKAPDYAVFLAGLSVMSLTVVVLLAYQSVFGYVYERVGLLTAAFMAGSAFGARAARNALRPLLLLRTLVAALLLAALAAHLLFREEAFFLALTLLAGGLGGAIFSSASSSTAADPAAPGRLYALDLAGAFLGALLTTLVTVPLFGIGRALLLIAVLQGISFVVLLPRGHEQA